MSVPIFMSALEDNFFEEEHFFVGRQFIVKEFAVLKDGFELSHYIFGYSEPWSIHQ